MKTKILIILSLITFASCGTFSDPKDKPDEYYIDVDLRIVSINSECSLTPDKFHKPQLCNTILFETLSEPHLYRELNTCTVGNKSDSKSKPVKIWLHTNITTEWLYNHRVGDTVHFDYLFKSEFFPIKER